LPSEAFARDDAKRLGFKSICKPCDREKSRLYYAENRDRIRARMASRPSTQRRRAVCDKPATSQRHHLLR
jgi:hypothetical protein